MLNIKPYFHVSAKDLSNSLILFPRIPYNFLTRNGFENNITPRVCLSDSILGCLLGLGANIADKILHVYQVDYSYSQPKLKFIDNTEVPDQSITKEVWSVDAVKLKKFITIKVQEGPDVKIQYYDYKFNVDVITTYCNWNYTIIKKDLVTDDL